MSEHLSCYSSWIPQVHKCCAKGKNTWHVSVWIRRLYFFCHSVDAFAITRHTCCKWLGYFSGFQWRSKFWMFAKQCHLFCSSPTLLSSLLWSLSSFIAAFRGSVITKVVPPSTCLICIPPNMHCHVVSRSSICFQAVPGQQNCKQKKK